jgi:hypothetical protein
MDNVTKSISQQAPLLILMLGVGVLVLAIVAFRLSAKVKAMQSRWEALLHEASGANIERLLEDHFHERRQLMTAHDETRRRVEVLEDKMDGSKRHLGVIRYDAFDEVGGAQSFALALYDDRGDGVVINSLVGRADCRVYGKALSRGRAERTLSQEEQRAIDEAQRTSPRPMIAP